jgi:hypothetical protein
VFTTRVTLPLKAGERFALAIVVVSRKIVKATRRCDCQHANQTKYRLHLASSNETVYYMKLFVPIGPVTANADFARDSGTGVQRLAPSHATAPSERRGVGSSRQSSSRAIHKQGTNPAERQPPHPSLPAAGRTMEMYVADAADCAADKQRHKTTPHTLLGSSAGFRFPF